MNTGYPIPAGLPEPAKRRPLTYTQGEPHKHEGVDCVLWSSCSRMSDDQTLYLTAYETVRKYGKHSPEAQRAAEALRDHPWALRLLRVTTGIEEGA